MVLFIERVNTITTMGSTTAFRGVQREEPHGMRIG
jgi:hypothetical protein